MDYTFHLRHRYELSDEFHVQGNQILAVIGDGYAEIIFWDAENKKWMSNPEYDGDVAHEVRFEHWVPLPQTSPVSTRDLVLGPFWDLPVGKQKETASYIALSAGNPASPEKKDEPDYDKFRDEISVRLEGERLEEKITQDNLPGTAKYRLQSPDVVTVDREELREIIQVLQALLNN